MIFQCQAKFLQNFNTEYLRNNKTNGSKNIRCFPQCSTSHCSQGFCGQPVFVEFTVEYHSIDGTCDSVNDLVFAGEFQPLSDEFAGITESIAESVLLRNSLAPNVKYIIAKSRVVSTTAVDSFGKFRRVLELRFETKPWQYLWTGNRFRQATYHSFVVSALTPNVNDAFMLSSYAVTTLNLLQQFTSPTFTISCMRRRTGPKEASIAHTKAMSNSDCNNRNMIELMERCGQEEDALESLLTMDMVRCLERHSSGGEGTTSVDMLSDISADDSGSGSDIDKDGRMQEDGGYLSDAPNLALMRPMTSPARLVRQNALIHTVTPPRNTLSTSSAFRSVHSASRSPFSMECASITLDMSEDNGPLPVHSLSMLEGKYRDVPLFTEGAEDGWLPQETRPHHYQQQQQPSRSQVLAGHRESSNCSLWERYDSQHRQEQAHRPPISGPYSPQRTAKFIAHRSIPPSGRAQRKRDHAECAESVSTDCEEIVTLPVKLSMKAFPSDVGSGRASTYASSGVVGRHNALPPLSPVVVLPVAATTNWNAAAVSFSPSTHRSATTRGSVPSAQFVIPGFPLFPSAASRVDTFACCDAALVAEGIASEESMTISEERSWSHVQRSASHSKMLKALFPQLNVTLA